MVKLGFRFFGCSSPKFSKSVIYFDVGIFFVSFLGSSLSNRGVKSKNEFAVTENQWTKGVRHVTKNLRKISIFAGAQKSKFLFRHIVS